MAHPIRPESYIKMDNFYTLTVYEKGELCCGVAPFGPDRWQGHQRVSKGRASEPWQLRAWWHVWALLHLTAAHVLGKEKPCSITPTHPPTHPLFLPAGAEVVRLYEQVLGKAGFRKGMDLYFQRHDGQVGRWQL